MTFAPCWTGLLGSHLKAMAINFRQLKDVLALVCREEVACLCHGLEGRLECASLETSGDCLGVV